MPASSRSRPASSARPRRVWKRPSQRRPRAPCAPRRCCSSPAFATTATTPARLSRSPNKPSKRSGDDELLKPHLQLELAAAAEAVGDRARASAHAREAVALGGGRGDDATLAEALALVGFHDFLAGEGDARDAMSRALELEGAAVSVRPLRSPTFRQACLSMWMDELDAARSTFVDLAKRCREGGDEGSLAVILFMLAQVECCGRQLVGCRRVRRRELRDHRVDRPPAVSLAGSVSEGAGRRAPRSSGVGAGGRRGRAGARRTIRVGAGESVQPRGVGVPRAVAGQPEGERTSSCGPSPRACSPRASESLACFGSSRMRSRRSSRSARRTRRASILEPFAAQAERSTERGRSRPPNAAGACSTRRSASSPMRLAAFERASSTTRCSTSPSSSVGRSWHRVKRSAA